MGRGGIGRRVMFRPHALEGLTMARFTLLSCADVDQQKDPAWLIDGIFPQDAFIEMFGPPKSFKSFLAISVGCSIATGLPFLGAYPVLLTGDVVYICAEGTRGLGKRRRAWEAYSNGKQHASNFFAIGEPVNMYEGGEWDAVVEAVKTASRNPVLIVVDTL